MSIPFIIFAAVYFLLFFCWIVLTLITFYHVFRYAYWTRLPLVLVFVYLFLSACILAGTGWSLREVDWQGSAQVTTPDVTIPQPGTLTNSSSNFFQ